MKRILQRLVPVPRKAVLTNGQAYSPTPGSRSQKSRPDKRTLPMGWCGAVKEAGPRHGSGRIPVVDYGREHPG
jgi:hypothetical protein